MFAIVLTLSITLGVLALKTIESFTEIQKARAGSSSGNPKEIEALRAEVANLTKQLNSLRDTATQYDMSFDSALQNFERRVEMIERDKSQIQRLGN